MWAEDILAIAFKSQESLGAKGGPKWLPLGPKMHNLLAHGLGHWARPPNP